jgi:type IV secretory pathway VirJ component
MPMPGNKAIRSGRRRWPRYLLGGLALVLAGFLLWLAYIGAFGGRLYFDLPARRSAADPARHDVAAVIFSGDMGFRVGMGPVMGEAVAASGIPVTGVSSLVHFRKRRRPAEVRAFVEAAMAHAMRTTGAKRLILIGQSYGADMLHTGLATLPASRRRDIAMVALIVPTDTIYYRISPSELFEWNEADAPALPTARRLDWLPVLCLRGATETDSLCPAMRQANVEHIILPGGHRLNWDDHALSAALLGWIQATLRNERPDI